MFDIIDFASVISLYMQTSTARGLIVYGCAVGLVGCVGVFIRYLLRRG